MFDQAFGMTSILPRLLQRASRAYRLLLNFGMPLLRYSKRPPASRGLTGPFSRALSSCSMSMIPAPLLTTLHFELAP